MHQMSGCNTVLAEPFMNIPYFYEPIFFPEDLLPLSNMTIVFSLYSADEFDFLSQMATLLGAAVEESFVRAKKPLLVCSKLEGSKYNAAIRWMLPVVDKKWLIECHRVRKRIPLRKYLIGAAIAPVDDVQEEEEDEEVPCSQSYEDPLNDLSPSIQGSIMRQFQQMEKDRLQTKKRRHEADGNKSSEVTKKRQVNDSFLYTTLVRPFYYKII